MNLPWHSNCTVRIYTRERNTRSSREFFSYPTLSFFSTKRKKRLWAHQSCSFTFSIKTYRWHTCLISFWYWTGGGGVKKQYVSIKCKQKWRKFVQQNILSVLHLSWFGLTEATAPGVEGYILEAAPAICLPAIIIITIIKFVIITILLRIY